MMPSQVTCVSHEEVSRANSKERVKQQTPLGPQSCLSSQAIWSSRGSQLLFVVHVSAPVEGASQQRVPSVS